jgi:uncharacterized protein with PQ loop repeat
MEWDHVQVTAGLFSSLIFATGTLTMLTRTLRTKDVESYSPAFILLNNLGNFVYWLYVLSLPFGPIYLLHGFYTVAMVIMLVCYIMYQKCPHST